MSQSQQQIVNGVREHNEVRVISNQGYIGGLYFLVALAMVMYVIAIAMIQAYVLPLKRFEHVNKSFANPKVVAIIYAIKLAVLYFLISMTGGMTGFIVASSVLLLWAIALIFVGSIRRCLRFEDENAEKEGAALASNIEGDNVIKAGSRRAKLDRQNEITWTGSPAPMGPGQLGAILVATALLLLNITTMLLIVYLWEVPDYQVVTVVDQPLVEFQPQMTAKALQFMYAFPRMATTLQLDVYVKLLTEYCGVTYTQELTNPDDKVKLIKEQWIDEYAINMTEYVLQDVQQYHSVNDWFTRAVNMTYRPLPAEPRAITSPADARTLIFASIVESRQWFKGYDMDVNALIGHIAVNGNSNYFNGGGMVISRLAPQDYHRFHAPVSGSIVAIHHVPGSLWSVGYDAVRSGNEVFLNQREVIVIDAGPTIGYVAFVAIGATCVGSVVLQDATGAPLAAGQLVDRGDQLGVMQFGGSTVVTLFASNRIEYDEDLLTRSHYPVETFVKVNHAVGLSRQ
jgi:phosphatidylserine decarboxylase